MNWERIGRGGLVVALLAVLGLLIAWAAGAFKSKDDKNCDDPTDDEKAAAGGDYVLTFKFDTDSGNCVANTCVSGLPPQNGICMASVSGGNVSHWAGCDTDADCKDADTYCLKSDINKPRGRCLTYGDCRSAAWTDCTTMESRCATDEWKATGHPKCKDGTEWVEPYDTST